MDSENSSYQNARHGDAFVTTRWTMILAASIGDQKRAIPALQELCRIYWYPLYAYLRGRGHTREDAEDLTQSFLSQILSEKNLARLDPSYGRFRAFLLSAIKHFISNERDRALAQKRGGAATLVSLDLASAEARYEQSLCDNLTPDRQFDRAWALSLLDRVLQRLEDEFLAQNRAAAFAALKPFLTMDNGDIPYATAAEALDLSEGAARVAVHRLRKRYRELLRQEIAETLSDPRDLDEEVRSLLLAF